jgi:DNA-directed RNA polymerase specialized sigma24 family protein
MAAEGSRSLFRLNAVDRRGRKITPSVLEAAEEIYPDALEHGCKLLGDPAVVTNVLEEVAAAVSRTARVKNPPGSPMQRRELRLYLFRAFLHEVNRQKRKVPRFVNLSEVVAVSNPRWADPLQELDDKILLDKFLTLCKPWMKDMVFRQLQGFSWEEIGEAYGVSGHAAQTRFSYALSQLRERLKI